MTSLLTELKQFEGQPWSSWTEFIGHTIPPELSGAEDVGQICMKQEVAGAMKLELDGAEDIGQISIKQELAGTMKLNKSDMGIYGQYPGAELFELAVCEFCGDKFKLAALPDHVVLRHQDGKKVAAIDISNIALTSKEKLLPLHLQKKGKSRHGKHGKERSVDKGVVSASPNKIKSKPSGLDKIKLHPVETKADDVKLSSPLTTGTTTVTSCKPEKVDSQAVTTLTKQTDNIKIKQLKMKLKKPKRTSELFTNSPKTVSHRLVKNSNWLHTNNLVKPKEKSKTEVVKRPSVKHDQISSMNRPKTPESPAKTDDISKMQPVVQLSPLDYPHNSSKSGLSNSGSGAPEMKKKSKSEKKVVLVKDRTYNPDRHCGVIGKENTKPCTRSLTCKSHSMSLRRAVRGRSKAFDVLLADHRAEKEHFKKKISSSCANSTTTASSQPVILTSNKKGDIHKLKVKGRNVVPDYSRLSLPVSIKNPNVFSHAKNPSGKAKGLSSLLNNGSNVKLIGPSSILKKQTLKPLRPRQENIPGFKNILPAPTPIQQYPLIMPKPVQMEAVQQWHPGYRRCGGLLYSNINVPKINATASSSQVDNIGVNDLISSKMITVVKPPSSVVQIPKASQDSVKRIPLSLGPGKKKAVATLIPKQATSLLTPVNVNGKSLLSNQQQKVAAVVQVSSPQQQNGLVYPQNLASKRVLQDNMCVPSKRLKKDIVGPIITKTTCNNTPIMRLSIANGVIEKEVITNANIPFTSGGRSFQPGVSLLQNNGLRISNPQRVHYVTSSGPLPVTLQQLPVVPQVQLKPIEVKARGTQKLKLIAPNMTVTPPGMVFIKKEQRP